MSILLELGPKSLRFTIMALDHVIKLCEERYSQCETEEDYERLFNEGLDPNDQSLYMSIKEYLEERNEEWEKSFLIREEFYDENC